MIPHQTELSLHSALSHLPQFVRPQYQIYPQKYYKYSSCVSQHSQLLSVPSTQSAITPFLASQQHNTKRFNLSLEELS